MSRVANVQVTLDATGVAQRLKEIRNSAIGTSKAFQNLSDRARAVKAAVEAQQGGFAKASTVQGVFAAKVKNTEQAIRAQILALRQVQSRVQLGGALYQKAAQQIAQYEQVLRQADGAMKGATIATKGFGAALSGLVSTLAIVLTTVDIVRKGLDTAFARGAAEQKLKNFTDSAGEYNAALALAAESSQKFGISQTEATQALGDIYSRLKGLGFGLKETGEIYQGFNIIAKTSGTSAEDASGAFLQLSQALGSGRLQGDELRSILERMPTLAQAIAQSMGRSTAEIREMGKTGELTSEVIYKALSEAAAASGDLTGKLTEQQKAFNSLKQTTDALLNTIGKVFGPAVVAGANQLSALGQRLNQWWGYLGSVVFPKIYSAIKPVVVELQKIWTSIPWDTLLGYVQGILVKGFELFAGYLRLAVPPLTKMLQIIQAIAASPFFKFFAERAEMIAKFLGISSTNVKDFAEEQKKVDEAARKTVDQYSSMPQKIEDATEKQSELTEAVKGQLQENKLITQQIDNQIKAVENATSLRQAQLQTEKALNDLRIQGLERDYEMARSANKRLAILQSILRLELNNAQIVYEQKIAGLKLDNEKLKAEVQSQINKRHEIELEGQLQRIKAQGIQDDKKRQERLAAIDKETGSALAINEDMVKALSDQLPVRQQILQEQARLAKIEFESAKVTAQQKFEQKAVGKEVGLTTRLARNMSTQIARTVTVTNNLATSMGSVAQQAGNAAQQLQNAINLQNMLKSGGGGQSQQEFAAGGYVTGATNAVVGEAGPEYVIPAGKMSEAMSRYAAGQRGSSVIPSSINPQVNVTTGPVMNMNGSNYVSQRDFMAGMATASRRGAEMALQALQSNNGVRRAVGMG